MYGGGNAAVNINGGTITGSSYDVFISDDGGLASVKLGIGSGGAGPSFPGGLSINNLVGISALLNPNYYYMKNGNPVDMTGITTEILDGDVSIGYCDHSSNINGVPVADDATHHSLFCSNCQARIKQEQHSITGSICTGCGYGCSHPDVVTVDGVVKCTNCSIVMVAQVGDSYCARLSDAVAQANAVNGSTLTLLSDVKGDIVVNSGSSFTLDLNGKTLRGTGKSVITIGASGEGAASLIMKSSGGGGKVTGCYHQNAKGTVVVNTWSTFTMESGVISENMVDSGGGVYVAGGTFNMKGGEISGNTADNLGGGVYLAGESASFTMDGGSIRSNTVKVDDKNYLHEGIYGGGGVYVQSGTFTMNAGTISGNSSTYTRGGGVQVAQGTFVMNGGTIEGNSAAEKGGGVYVMKGENGNPSGTFTVDGSSVISGNTVNGSANNVYLAVPLTIGSNLSTTAGIGITGSITPTDTGVEIASSGATEINKSAFISDNINYSIVQKEGKLYLYPHIHSWNYELDGTNTNTIKATCQAASCPGAEEKTIVISAEGKTYDGTPVTATLDGSIDGVAAPEITYSGNTNAGTYTASITLGDATASVEFTIEKATVTVTADAKSKTYGTENPELTYTASGLFEGDTLTGAPATTATKNSDVGEYDITVGTLANSNYTINFVGAKLTITKAAAPTIVWPTASGLTYGQKLSESTLTSEDENGTFAWQDDSIVPTVANNGYVVVYTPKDMNNYDYSGVELTKTITVDVSRKTVTITAENKTICVGGTYTLTYTVNGLIGSDTLTAEPTLSTDGTVNTAGEYAITVSGATVGDNYTITYENGTLTVQNHAYTGVMTTTPTCMAGGEMTYTCSHDSTHTYTEDVAIDENAHSWNEGAVTTNPTCSAVGTKTFTCTHNSAHTYTEDVAIDENAHIPNADDGDCTTDITCSVCGEVTTEGADTHTGGTATCEHKAECTVCGKEYGNLANHSPNADDNDCTTDITCSVCGDVTSEGADTHTGGTATCENKAECTVCGKEYGNLANHSPNADDGDCTTDITCSICGDVTSEGEDSHTGGTATCEEKAECTVCGKAYGTLANHIPNADDGDCTTDITCSICGDVTTEGADSHTGGTATCEHKAECTVCGKEYGNLADHIFVEGKCECGETDPNYVPPHEHTFVEGKCECGETDPNYQPPHEHTFVDGKCECGETDPNYVPPHEHTFVDGKCECGETDPNYIPPHEHNFVEGKCECGETDPNYTPGTDEPGTDVPGSDEPEEPKNELSGGAIAGIVTGSVVVLGGGGFALWWFVIKKKRFLSTK